MGSIKDGAGKTEGAVPVIGHNWFKCRIALRSGRPYGVGMSSSTAPSSLGFGLFLPPFHPVEENPSLALERDAQLVEHVERMDFDEAWIGEHHSGGWEIISSPELFIAALAGRTSRIKLGAGVVSLPYHHPYMVAERAIQLSHHTKGRFILGLGPGALPSDAAMLGLDAPQLRPRTQQAASAVVRLLAGETVTEETDWYTLRDARVQLRPYQGKRVEVCAASVVSPSGAVLAGSHGLGLLSIGGTSQAGFSALAQNWSVTEKKAAEAKKSVHRKDWRVVGLMHIAPTREQAREDVKSGLDAWVKYFNEVAALPLVPSGSVESALDSMMDSGIVMVGDPDDATAHIRNLQEQTGGFGKLLLMGHNWANYENTRRSYELIARYVMPKFQHLNQGRSDSMEYVRARNPEFSGAAATAVAEAVQLHTSDDD